MKEEKLSEVPAISFLDYQRFKDVNNKDSLILIRYSFSDGNGDLGYTFADTFPPFRIGDPYFYNLHADFYDVSGPNKVHYVDGFSGDTIRYNQRLQTLTPEGKYKGINGVMELRVDFAILKLNGHSPQKIQMELWLNDRALNESNRILTPEIDLDI